MVDYNSKDYMKQDFPHLKGFSQLLYIMIIILDMYDCHIVSVIKFKVG